MSRALPSLEYTAHIAFPRRCLTALRLRDEVTAMDYGWRCCMRPKGATGHGLHSQSNNITW
ncbi:hypothetical protein LIA77_06174 [Sarocladium implicatum]|nr:hypothetical protein LIA77_06174 [Sarocladium implicatum]